MRLIIRALLALALCATGAVAAAPAAHAATCSDVELVFARGTGEMPGLGIVGGPLLSDLRSALPGKSVTSYAVNYAAAADQSSVPAGSADMSNRVIAQAAACPAQRFVLGGYSQGASVLDSALGIRSYLGNGPAIPTSLAPRIAAVAAFGNPLGMFRQTIKSQSALYGPRSIEFCNAGDYVCGGPSGPMWGHLTYGYDGSTGKAAAFAAPRV